jgi:hypothetical protein
MKTTILLLTILLSFKANSQVPNYLPTNGLIGWWPFNGDANDESGNGNNGIINGAILTTDRNGQADKAYHFDGNNDFIQTPNQSLSGSVTFSCWYKMDNFNTPGNDMFYVSNQSMTNDIYSSNIAFGFRSYGGQYGQSTYISSPITGYYAINSLPTVDVWHHFVSVFENGSFVKLYLDNTLIYSNNNVISNSSLPSYPLLFGGTGTSNFYYFSGELDDVSIWNRALSEQEILALYQGCQLNISTQPSNQSVNLSVGNTSFNVASNAINPTFQWQTNLGLGFQALSNAGQYNGVNTANLIVSNLNTSNNNQTFRCIINDNGCVDTTNIATLAIIDDASVFEDNTTSITISPNPITNSFSIAGIENIVSLTLKDLNGNLVKTFDIQEKNHSITNVSAGIYFLELRDDNRSQVIRLVKE